jgi:hypothetical protein
MLTDLERRADALGPTQRQVNYVVKRGLFFSIFWLFGIGSVIAILKGLEARRMIASSGGRLRRAGGAWWCIIVGSLGIFVLFWFLLTGDKVL